VSTYLQEEEREREGNKNQVSGKDKEKQERKNREEKEKLGLTCDEHDDVSPKIWHFLEMRPRRSQPERYEDLMKLRTIGETISDGTLH
jgi:hypothetical protein